MNSSWVLDYVFDYYGVYDVFKINESKIIRGNLNYYKKHYF